MYMAIVEERGNNRPLQLPRYEADDECCALVEDEDLAPWTWVSAQAEDNKIEVVHCVFHSPCKDGFGAAWAYYRSLVDNPPDRPVKVIFTPENHRWHKTRALLERATIGKETVLFLDICPTRQLLLQIHAATAGRTKVYDHHITGQRDCGDLEFCYFDMKRSGAGITWDTFCKKPRPFLIDCVEAGDNWKWTDVPGSPEVVIVLEVTTRFKFDQWDTFNKRVIKDLESVLTEGQHYIKYRDIITQMLTGRKVHKLTVGGVTIPAVNASIFQSGVGAHMVNTLKQPAAIYYWNGQYWAFSLRSADHLADVSKIAEKYGGGGHHNAAGFKVDTLEELDTTSRSKGLWSTDTIVKAFSSYSTEEQDRIERLLSPTQVDHVDNWEWTSNDN